MPKEKSRAAARGKIYRISISDSIGTKKGNVNRACLLDDFGIKGDAHAGTERQVSLLPYESFARLDNELMGIEPGDFAENITTIGLDFSKAGIGRTLCIGESVKLVITDIGKECHHGCRIREIVGDCIMPREGIFARVERGGNIAVGDAIVWE